jgi:hypothetical protein
MTKLNIESFDLDDLPEDDVMKEKKKKVNGKKKGNRYELEVSKDLSSRFKDTFRRVPQSGAIVGGLNKIYNEGLRSDAQEIFAGDVISPQWFPFCLECKNYANTPKMTNLLSIGDKDLDAWIKQSKTSGITANKDWLLLFKITEGRKSFACMNADLYFRVCKEDIKRFIIYKDTIIIDYKTFMDTLIKNFFPSEIKERL